MADRQRRVEEVQHDVGPANRALGPRQAVKLDVVLDFALVANPGGVDGDERFAVALEANVDAVARRAGHFADNGTGFLGQAVDEGALAGIAPPDDRDFEVRLRKLGRRFIRGFGRKTFEDQVEQHLFAAILLGLTQWTSPNPNL